MIQKQLKSIVMLLFILPASSALVPGQAKMATSPCEMSVAELPELGGLAFATKMEDIKNHFKTIRVLTAPRTRSLYQIRIYMLRPLKTDPLFKDDLLSVDLAHSSIFGITSIALNFRPKTKLTPAELFSKITLETGLPASNWTYDDFGGKVNYRKWDVVCSDFHAVFTAQTGLMNRLSIWRHTNSDPKRKSADSRNIGD